MIVFDDRSVVEPEQALVGPTWLLDAIVVGEVASSVPEGINASLEFDRFGRVQLHSGCNSGKGDVEIGVRRLKFHSMVLTAMGCPGAADEIERHVLAVLSASLTDYRIECDTLTITTGDLGLVFRAQP